MQCSIQISEDIECGLYIYGWFFLLRLNCKLAAKPADEMYTLMQAGCDACGQKRCTDWIRRSQIGTQSLDTNTLSQNGQQVMCYCQLAHYKVYIDYYASRTIDRIPSRRAERPIYSYIQLCIETINCRSLVQSQAPPIWATFVPDARGD